MKKYRIGIVGTENSHAHAFAKMFNLPDKNGALAFPDCRVTLVYGSYPEESKKLVEECGAEAVADSIGQMVKSVDAVMITARDGKYHYGFAKPFIEAGIPAFVDKTFTVSEDEAAELTALAAERHVPLSGGSSLKFAEAVLALRDKAAELDGSIKSGFIAAPLNMHNDYGGFFFYSSHLAEICLTVFGGDPKSVVAVRNNDSVCAIVNYDRFSVTANFSNSCNAYSGSIFSENAYYHRDIDLSSCAFSEAAAFVNMLRTGEMPHTYEQLAAPVFFLNAVKEAYETGKEVQIRRK